MEEYQVYINRECDVCQKQGVINYGWGASGGSNGGDCMASCMECLKVSRRAYKKHKKQGNLSNKISKPEPPPKNRGVAVTPCLVAFLKSKGERATGELVKSRSRFGELKYGQPLMTLDGRNSVEDALQELGDLMQYIWKAHMNKEDTTPFMVHMNAMRLILEKVYLDEDPQDSPIAHALVPLYKPSHYIASRNYPVSRPSLGAFYEYNDFITSMENWIDPDGKGSSCSATNTQEYMMFESYVDREALEWVWEGESEEVIKEQMRSWETRKLKRDISPIPRSGLVGKKRDNDFWVSMYAPGNGPLTCVFHWRDVANILNPPLYDERRSLYFGQKFYMLFTKDKNKLPTLTKRLMSMVNQ